MCDGDAATGDITASVAICFSTRRISTPAAGRAAISSDTRGTRRGAIAAILTINNRILTANVPVLLSPGDGRAIAVHIRHLRCNLAGLTGTFDDESAAASTWGNVNINTAVSGAPSATPRRFQPQQPPSLGGIVEVVHLPAGALGAAASAPWHRRGREITDTMRLGIRQPRHTWRLAVP
jgi:hypothetical protein